MTEAVILRALHAITGGRRAQYGGGGEWVAHRVLVWRWVESTNSGGSRMAPFLDVLRTSGLVWSYGRGRNRHHALTAAGLTAAGKT